jgi:hypothetical protein
MKMNFPNLKLVGTRGPRVRGTVGTARRAVRRTVAPAVRPYLEKMGHSSQRAWIRNVDPSAYQ